MSQYLTIFVGVFVFICLYKSYSMLVLLFVWVSFCVYVIFSISFTDLCLFLMSLKYLFLDVISFFVFLSLPIWLSVCGYVWPFAVYIHLTLCVELQSHTNKNILWCILGRNKNDILQISSVDRWLCELFITHNTKFLLLSYASTCFKRKSINCIKINKVADERQ